MPVLLAGLFACLSCVGCLLVLLYFVFLLSQAKILVPLPLSVQLLTVLTSRSFALLPAKDRCLFCIKKNMVAHFQCAISKTNGRFRAWVVCLNMHGCGCTSMCCLFICLFLRDSSGSHSASLVSCRAKWGTAAAAAAAAVRTRLLQMRSRSHRRRQTHILLHLRRARQRLL